MRNCRNIVFHFDVSEMFSADRKHFFFAREPLLRRMPDGSLFALIYTGGKEEPACENYVACIRSTDDGTTWTKPETVFRHPALATWATELFTAGPRPFCIFQTFDYAPPTGRNIFTGYSTLHAHMAFTDDSGRSWSEPYTLPGLPANFTVRQGKILSDSSWIFPVYWAEIKQNWKFLDGKVSSGPEMLFNCGMIRTTDEGRSFQLYGGISCRGKYNAWEPDITELENGHLRMFIRCESPERVLWESDSFDFGKSWTEAHPGKIPNPGTKLMIVEYGKYKLLLNNVCTQEKPNRDELQLWVSSDGLKSWKKKISLASLKSKKDGGNGLYEENEDLPQAAYPHAFADGEKRTLYVAIDSVRKFFLMKVPFSAIF